MEFSLDPVHVLPLSMEVPDTLRDHILPITQQRSSATGKGFQFLLQEAAAGGLRLIYSTYSTTRPIRLHLRDERPLVLVILALRHDRLLDIEGLGVIRLKEGQFNALYLPRWAVQSVYAPSQESITLDIEYDDKSWAEFAAWFPLACRFLHTINAGQPALLLPANGWIPRETTDSLYRMLHTDKSKTGFPLYFSLALRTILFQLLQQSQEPQPPGLFTHEEMGGINAARDMIRDNIRRHYSIPEIAKRIGINEFKLKSGFRELFGQGIYGYLQSERMLESARLLMETRLTIKEIADKTGYRSVNSFIKAFRKRFGITPGRYRRQR